MKEIEVIQGKQEKAIQTCMDHMVCLKGAMENYAQEIGKESMRGVESRKEPLPDPARGFHRLTRFFNERVGMTVAEFIENAHRKLRRGK